jgi:hypothetical protein
VVESQGPTWQIKFVNIDRYKSHRIEVTELSTISNSTGKDFSVFCGHFNQWRRSRLILQKCASDLDVIVKCVSEKRVKDLSGLLQKGTNKHR